MKARSRLCGSVLVEWMLMGSLLAGVTGCDRPGPLASVWRSPPAPPAWAAPLVGQPLAHAFPGVTACLGSIDGTLAHYRGARKVTGWAWNAGAARDIDRLAVVDGHGRMIGFGEGGGLRYDVPAARREVRSDRTGWWVMAPGEGRTVYGLDAQSGSACAIGPTGR